MGMGPLYNWIERSVDTVFMSDGYPDGWTQQGCDLRYRYKFWRSPFRMKASGQTLDLSFTGFYQMEGSTRVCARGVVISPWTPPCRCGYTEGARKVKVRFVNTLSIQPKFQIQLKIQPQLPKPSDACKVCFWEQDITKQVMDGLSEELSVAKKAFEKQYGIIDLRSKLAQVWSDMNRPVALGEYGWLMVRPLGFRVNRIAAIGDTLDLSVGMRARPVVVNTVPQAYMTALPTDWDKPTSSDDFSVKLSLDLRYDSLSSALNRSLMPVEIKPEKGPFRKTVRIDSIFLTGREEKRIRCLLHISGKYAGQLEMSGVPVWDSATESMKLSDIDIDLKTRHLILGKAAAWFDKPIRKWLAQKFQFDLAKPLREKSQKIEKYLSEVNAGPLQCRGKLDQTRWLGWNNNQEGMRLQIGIQGRMQCKANLSGFSL